MIEQSSKAILSLLGLVVMLCLVAAGLLMTGELDSENPVQRSQDQTEPTQAGGSVDEAEYAEDGRRLYEGEYQSAYVLNRDNAEQSTCVDLRTVGEEPLLSVLTQIFDDNQSVKILATLEQQNSGATNHSLCNQLDGTALLVTSLETTAGTEYRMVFLADRLGADTWDAQQGEVLLAATDEEFSIYSNEFFGVTQNSPTILLERVNVDGDVLGWKAYQVDSDSGTNNLVEECEIVAINGQMQTACAVIN